MSSIQKFAFAALTIFAAACSSDSAVGPSNNDPNPHLTVDASTSTQYVALGSPAALVSVANPATSTAWDISFNATTVQLNGGASGPGTVSAYCVCQNQTKTDAQILAQTSASALADFANVTAASIPSNTALFKTDVQALAITGWYNFNATTMTVTPNAAAIWGLKLTTTPGAVAKLHVIAIPTPGQTNAGPVTLEYATASAPGVTLGTDHQLIVDASSGATVYVNLSTNSTSLTSTNPWDIALQGYKILVNGGTSGTGTTSAVSYSAIPPARTYASITSIDAQIPSSAFVVDGAGGVFAATPWFRYDITGNHEITPTYDVYLIKKGTQVYKLQITSYYDTNAAARHVTFRYALIQG